MSLKPGFILRQVMLGYILCKIIGLFLLSHDYDFITSVNLGWSIGSPTKVKQHRLK